MERPRIQFKSPFEVKDGLFGLKFMEGGGYISDWLHKVSPHSYSTATVPEKVAKSILEGIGLSVREFGNKDFVCFTNAEDVTGHDDRPMTCFLYKHDFRWQLYTLNTY